MDKMRGGWIGQIIGVGWALPTEFKYPSRIIPAQEVPDWKPERIDQHFNDDIFFNLIALQLVEATGLEADDREIAINWLNRGSRRSGGRFHGRHGVAPPDLAHPRRAGSGKWGYANLHMYSEFAGFICPGMPRQAAEVIQRFTYKGAETRYDGQFVAALVAEAFFEDDVHKLIETGLSVLPPQSQYAEAIRDVVAWHEQSPEDWKGAWRRIQAKYFEKEAYLHGLDPGPGTGDAKIHGAYMVLGLLYGEGDLARSIVLTMRCGQDSDCSASNTGSVLGVILGAKGIDSRYTKQLAETQRFNHAEWSLKQAYAACRSLARDAVVRAGGDVVRDGRREVWRIVPYRRWEVGEYIKWWDPPELTGSRFTRAEMEKIEVVGLGWALENVLTGWSADGASWRSGMAWRHRGRDNVLLLESERPGRTLVVTSTVETAADNETLRLAAGGKRPWRLDVVVDGETLRSVKVGASDGYWQEVEVDLPALSIAEAELELRATPMPGDNTQGGKKRRGPVEMAITGLDGLGKSSP
jgi:hypothetical protein